MDQDHLLEAIHSAETKVWVKEIRRVDRILALERRIGELEKAVLAGGAERRLTVAEFALRNRRAESTVRKWIKSAALRRSWRLEGVFTYDGGRLLTTVERERRWQDLIAAKGRAK